ncbi:MAG TPA: hypothetical protein VGM67_00270 [Gemmatimonadaceae bacterium]|jgi:hypothetical protein
MWILGASAVIVGGLELLNTIIAAIAVARSDSSPARAALAILVGVVSALLLASGIALLVRPRNSIGFARDSALATLVVFALLAALHPGFSMASMLLGIVFPIVMLLVIARRSSAQGATAAR